LLEKRNDSIRGTGKWLQGNKEPPELNISYYPWKEASAVSYSLPGKEHCGHSLQHPNLELTPAGDTSEWFPLLLTVKTKCI